MTEPYSKIVPNNIQEYLIAIRDQNTRNSWDIGDICEDVMHYCIDNQIIATHAEIYSAVASFAGKASRTVREMHHLAKFYPQEWREQFEVLSYDHFRTAATYGNRWQDMLYWAVSEVDRLGRPATVDSMEAHFSTLSQPNIPPEPEYNPQPAWHPEPTQQPVAPEPVYQERYSPNPIASLITSIESLKDIVAKMRDLEDEDRVIVSESLCAIEAVLEKHKLGVDNRR